MRNGSVVEEGFREDLEKKDGSEFRRTLEKQFASGGFPIKDVSDAYNASKQEAVGAVDRVMQSAAASSEVDRRASMWVSKHNSIVPSALTAPPWEVDAIHDILGPSRPAPLALPKKHLPPTRSRYMSSSARPSTLYLPPANGSEYELHDAATMHNNASTTSLPSPGPDKLFFQSTASAFTTRRSMTFEPAQFPRRPSATSSDADVSDDEDFTSEKLAMQNSGQHASRRRTDDHARSGLQARRAHWDQSAVTVAVPDEPQQEQKHDSPLPSLFSILCTYYHTVPTKGRVVLGLLFSVANGALTPVFSYLLARLLALVGAGAQDTSAITYYAILVLSVAFADGISNGAKFYLLENAAMA